MSTPYSGIKADLSCYTGVLCGREVFHLPADLEGKQTSMHPSGTTRAGCGHVGSLPASLCCHGRRTRAQLPPQAAGHERAQRQQGREGGNGPCAGRSATHVGS